MTFGLQTEEYVSRSILDGKHRHDAPPVEGRFTTAVGKAGAMYLERYWHQREFETIEKLRGIAEQAGESLAKTSGESAHYLGDHRRESRRSIDRVASRGGSCARSRTEGTTRRYDHRVSVGRGGALRMAQ